MLKAVLVAVTGIPLQIGICVINTRLWERLLPEQSHRRLNYIAYLLSIIIIAGIPCWVAVAFGLIPITLGAGLHATGTLIFLLALLANGGNLVESSIPAVLLVWIILFLIPVIQAANEQSIRLRG